MGDGHSRRIDYPLRLQNTAKELLWNLLLLVLAFELSVTATTAGESVKMLSHECALFTSGA
jgi:hypothetical protein